MQLSPELIEAFEQRENRQDLYKYSITKYMEPGETIFLEEYPYPHNGANYIASVIIHRNDGKTSIYWNMNPKRLAEFLEFKYEFEGGKKFDKDMKDLLT